MPIAKKQQVDKGNAASPKKHKWYKSVLVIGMVLALIVIVPFLIFWGGVASDTAGMSKYLQDKYGQEFKVKYSGDKGVSIGDPGQRIGTAYPVTDSGLTFEVGKSRNTGTYFDGYSEAVWEQEEHPRVASFLKTLYGVPTASDFELSTQIPTQATPDPIKGEVPSIDEAIKQYRNDFFYSLSITSSVDVLNDMTRSDVRAKFTTLAEYIKAKGAGLSYLTLKINVTSENAGYLCSLQKEQFNDIDTALNSCLSKPAKKGLYQ